MMVRVMSKPCFANHITMTHKGKTRIRRVGSRGFCFRERSFQTWVEQQLRFCLFSFGSKPPNPFPKNAIVAGSGVAVVDRVSVKVDAVVQEVKVWIQTTRDYRRWENT